MAKDPKSAPQGNGQSPDTKTISVGTKDKKMEFSVGQPYTEGHRCTAEEARALNQTRAENIGNNIRAKVQATIEGTEGAMNPSDLAKFVAEYDAKYVFTAPASGGGVTLSPEEREARKIATGLVNQHITKTGRKVADVKKADPEKYAAQVARIADSDQVKNLARKRVAELNSLPEVNLGAAA